MSFNSYQVSDARAICSNEQHNIIWFLTPSQLWSVLYTSKELLTTYSLTYFIAKFGLARIKESGDVGGGGGRWWEGVEIPV